LRHWRSKPMAALSPKATARLIAACSIDMVIADGSCDLLLAQEP
jgi:hypothetical protein